MVPYIDAEYIKNKSLEEIQRLLERRETCYNVNAIFHVVIGARYVHGDHEKVLIKLLSLGVDLGARDLAGYTPLHHCMQSVGRGNILTEPRKKRGFLSRKYLINEILGVAMQVLQESYIIF